MKIEIVEVKKGIKQITSLDERWYVREKKFYPSVTWICSYYPKGTPFYKWLAEKGWDEAEAIKSAAGNKGSKVHQASEDIEKGKKIKISDKYPNDNGEPEELSVEEVKAIISFRDWLDTAKPELVACEVAMFNEEYGYAGTVDRIYRIDGQLWIIDLKTSKQVWPEHELQLSAYSMFDLGELQISPKEWANKKLGILQIGYNRNKAGYKLTEVENCFNVFLSARTIWEKENPNSKPKQIEIPTEIYSTLRTKK